MPQMLKIVLFILQKDNQSRVSSSWAQFPWQLRWLQSHPKLAVSKQWRQVHQSQTCNVQDSTVQEAVMSWLEMTSGSSATLMPAAAAGLCHCSSSSSSRSLHPDDAILEQPTGPLLKYKRSTRDLRKHMLTRRHMADSKHTEIDWQK